MASARLRRRDKQLESLVKENVKLHGDVRELEEAYQLHRTMVEEDRNSVKGLIRKETGGSRWQHGGTGKLTTYKSNKDLIESDGTSTPGRPGTSTTERRILAGSHRVNIEGDSNVRVKKGTSFDSISDQQVHRDEMNTERDDVIQGDGNPSKILDLKSKVLKKVSSKIIRRDTWAGSGGVKDLTTNKKGVVTESSKADDKLVVKNKKKDVVKSKVPNGRNVQEMNKPTKRSETISTGMPKKQPSEEIVTRRSRLDIHENTKKSSIKSDNDQVNVNPKHTVSNESPRSGRRRIVNETEIESLVLENNLRNSAQARDYSKTLDCNVTNEANVTFTNAELGSTSGTINNQGHVTDREGSNNLTLADESLERNTNRLSKTLQTESERTKEHDNSGKKNPSRTFQTEVAEPTEIYIDTEIGEIRVRSGEDKTRPYHSGLDTTKVLIQHRPVNKSVEGQRLPCTIVEDHQFHSAQQEVRDIFGLSDLDTHVKGHSSDKVRANGTSVSPFALMRHCNTEVEFWLHGLGLVDVDKYVRIFADHEVDLLDLEFMTAAQLHDMGITAIGALDKILKGVKDLRSGIKPKPSNRNDLGGSKRLDLSSIAWEEENSDHKDALSQSLDKDLKRKGVYKETLVHRSRDLLSSRNMDVSDVRPSSAMSVHSNCGESLSSSRSGVLNNTSSFTASTMASSAKCVEKRPPSAKSTTQTKGKSQPKTQGSIKRSNSSVSDNKTSKLSQLEGKPTKSVLIRHRSSSLSREPTPKQPMKKEKEEKEVKGRNLRYRSRSADVVKRKAMEGVQTAAKKFEVKQQRYTDTTQPLYHRDERMKARRDEMAARHQEREKHREFANDQSSDTDEETNRQQAFKDNRADEDGIGSLVTVNIMSQSASLPNRTSAPSPTIIYVLPPIRPRTPSVKGAAPSDSSTSDRKPDVRKSLRRVEPARRQSARSLAKPVDLQLTTNSVTPGKSSGRVSLREQEKSPRSQSEPESGYKTDGSTSYSQIEDKVTEIQKKIKRLKARATTGDLLTSTLVQDLQIQLQQFQHILGTNVETSREDNCMQGTRDIENGGTREIVNGTGNTSSRVPTNTPRTRAYANGSSNESSREPTDTPRTRAYVNSSSNESFREPGCTPRTGAYVSTQNREPGTQSSSPIEALLAEDQKMKNDSRTKDEVRMSKRELLDEMRKEKKHHHLQIRQLQQELERIRHADPVHSMELQQSEILFREEDMIGEGAFSEVYKGNYQGSEVAVKKLKLPLRPQDRNYFTAELSLLKELRHPRVVLLIGVCTADKHPLMVLEFMSKGSLYNYLHNPDNESFDHAVYFQVARDITAGMKYLHSHRPEVIHLDLKSMNVLLCQSFRAKIADFGFSKLKHDAGVKYKGKTKQKSLNVSTPAWMSPELLNKGEVTTKTDVFSFAVILWEMLTRKEPYHNLSVFQILERVRKNRRPEIPISAPEGLHLLISQCWDPNPAKRPKFKDILQILENLEFPPAWRELFKKSGVPAEALSNVESTRNIIKLVTDTLDLPGPPNFMLAPTPRSHIGQARSSTMDSPAKSSQRSARMQNSKRESIQSSQRESIGRSQRGETTEQDRWESETVTTLSGSEISDESEFTLKNLVEESSPDDSIISSDSDEGSFVTSSDVASTVISAKTQTVQKRPVNVFIPSLELSIESARKEFSAERDRISHSSWLSISLDDRTDRSVENHSMKKEETNKNKKINSETSLNLMSHRSSQSSTPSGVVLTENPGTSRSEKSLRTSLLNESSGSNLLNESICSSHLNESARSKRRNKNKDSIDSNDDLLMRESFSNLRPSSPKKRVSLTKKLMSNSLNLEGNSARSGPPSADQGSVPPARVPGSMSDRNRRMYDNSEDIDASELFDRGSMPQAKRGNVSDTSTRFNGHVDGSYDSFFGIPTEQSRSEKVSNKQSNVNITDSFASVDTYSKPIDLTENMDSERQLNSSRKSMCVVDNGEAESLPNEGNQSRTAVIDEVNDFIDKKARFSLSLSKDLQNDIIDFHKRNSQRYNRDSFDSKMKEYIGDDARLNMQQPMDINNKNSDSDKLDSQRGDTSNNVSVVKKTIEDNARLSFTHSLDEGITTLNTHTSGKDLIRSSQKYSTGNSVDDITRKDQSVEVNLSLIASEGGTTPESVTPKPSTRNQGLSQTDMKHKISSKDNAPKQSPSVLESMNDSQLISKDDSVSQTVRSTNTTNSNEYKHSLRSSVPQNNQELSNKGSHDKETSKSVEVKHDGGEQIRVVLNSEEVTERKKPVITPRKSKMKSPDTNMQNSDQHTIPNKEMLDNSHKLSASEDELRGSKRVSHLESNTSLNNTKESSMPAKGPSVDKSKRSNSRQKQCSTEDAESNNNTQQKSGKIRVKLRKDPLAPKLMVECPSSPVPPPPPPPPPVMNLSASMSTMSRSMMVEAPRLSMADELKTRLNQRQSISEGMKIVRRNPGNTSRPVKPENIIGTRHNSSKDGVPVSMTTTSGEPVIVQMDPADMLAPQQSDGLPSLVVKSLELRDQKDQLRSISKQHPDQLDDLSGASQEQLSSIADILRKAVMGRRLAMMEDADSVTQSMESSATGWSVDFS